MKNLEWWPYVPNTSRWSEVPWGEAKKINPNATAFVGHDETHFYFQEWGNPEPVKVPKNKE